MIEVREKYITRPDVLGGNGHGLCFSDGKEYRVSRCIIDLSAWPVRAFDEAVSVTWGSSAYFDNCVIIGGGKHILIGSGDADKWSVENGKQVSFERCLIADFGRRGPEVQSGMQVELTACVIANWGVRGRRYERGFAAWSHHGGHITARDTVFMQDALWRGLSTYLLDKWHHIGVAVSYRGATALVDPLTYMAGTRRGLTCSDGGSCRAIHCYASPGVYVEGLDAATAMSAAEAAALLGDARLLYAELQRELPCPKAA